MQTAATIATALLALLHVYILVLEMFLWTKPAGRKAFGLTPEFAEATRTLAGNQGLYNGFLAAGLAWALVAPPGLQLPVAVFFLACVVVAGVFGGFTVSRSILVAQAVPAAVALGLWIAGR